MDIEKSFTFPFEDKQWTSKLGLGALVSLIPILNFAWSGYMIGIIRNVMNNVTEPLPTWDDLGQRFMDGLILFAATLIYALPVLIGICLPASIMAFSGGLAASGDLDEISRMIAEAGGVVLICLSFVFLLYGLALSIVFPAIMVLFAREGTFAACFKFGEAVAMISRSPGPFFLAWALSLAVGFGAGLVIGFINLVLSFIPCIGSLIGLGLSFASVVYTGAVYAHLFGQFGREAYGQTQLVPAS